MLSTNRYKLSIDNESKLQNIWSLKLTPIRIIALIIFSLTIVIGLAITVIMLSPLKTLLPGYMKSNQRLEAVSALIKLDSIQQEYDKNQQYLNNIVKIFDTDRSSTDSLAITTPTNNESTDSLINPTDNEAKFVKMMEEREKYNISIIAPLAAEGMVFTIPAENAVISDESKKSTVAKLILSQNAGISSISDGTIIDIHCNSMNGTYSIIIQHSKGFVSKYAYLGQPIVDIGDKVITGQRIAQSVARIGRQQSFITIEMWRNGSPLLPYIYIKENGYKKEPVIDTDIGRGH